MSAPHAATLRQIEAADPAGSAWLSANAGSGKTRVLTDRVARLLLRGTDPQNILCLTFTRAAATEMQNRLFRRLGEWAMLEDAALGRELARLGEPLSRDPGRLAAARRLFAQAMDVPGGLRIQTIHAFCAGLLRRFPLEAGISPAFSELDERAAELLRAEIAEDMAAGPDAAAVDGIARWLGGTEIGRLIAAICARADLFRRPFDDAALRARLGLPAGLTEDALLAGVAGPDDLATLRALATLCASGSTTDRRAAAALAGVAPDGRPRLADLSVMEEVLLSGPGAKAPFTARTGSFPTRATRAADPALAARADDLMRRVEAARPLRLGLGLLARSRDLHAFASRFLARYDAAKLRRGVVDFDDLILRSRALLTDPAVAQWVLFRLDGGIDHLLVDEAQDTSPAQWEVIRALTQEFAAGEGARPGRRRTVFVVGDKKQSIYSFQGADPEGFDRMRDHFAGELARIGEGLLVTSLEHSFRSSEAILSLVDLVFAGDRITGLGPDPVRHRAFHADLPGRVDLWPAVPAADRPEAEAGHWTDPPDSIGPEDPAAVLADRIAGAIAAMVGRETIPRRNPATGLMEKRPLSEGDILILVRRRSDIFAAVIRALKQRGLRVAGSDRIRVGAELAVRDIGALLRFLALPADDLALAEALRSPLLGWSEAELYRLAQGRPPGQGLWQALREGAADSHPATLALLQDMRDAAEFLRPFDLITRLLVRHDGRRRLLARLGTEAEDGIDALLSQALAYEATEIPSLTGFVTRMQTADIDVRRQLDSAGDSIRVMTVHGAKGLEAPVVILPDTAVRRPQDGEQVLALGGVPVLVPPAAEMPPALAALRDDLRAAQERENRRLLYVAMTRAESWLIVCGAGETGRGEDSWYGMVADGMAHAGAVAQECPGGTGLRLARGDWDALPAAGAPPAAAPLPALPELPPVGPLPPDAGAVLAPTALGGAKVLPGDTAPEEGEAALARGRLVHLLLDHLPRAAPADRPALAQALVAASEDRLLAGPTEDLVAGCLALAGAAHLAPLRDPAALTEVDVTAPVAALGGRRVRGTLDRLLIGSDRITAIDYKTNRLVPRTPGEVPEGILRQMGAYAAMLAAVWPGYAIEVAILWTATGVLMPLPRDLVMAALERAGADLTASGAPPRS